MLKHFIFGNGYIKPIDQIWPKFCRSYLIIYIQTSFIKKTLVFKIQKEK